MKIRIFLTIIAAGFLWLLISIMNNTWSILKSQTMIHQLDDNNMTALIVMQNISSLLIIVLGLALFGTIWFSKFKNKIGL